MRVFILLLLSASLSSMAMGQSAIAQMVDSLSQDTLNYQSMYMVGKIYEHKSRNSRALPFFERADKLAPSDSAKFRIAYNMYHSGFYKRCIELTKGLVDRDSTSVDNLTMLAAGYERIMARDSAAMTQIKIMHLEPDNNSALVAMCKNLIALDEQMPKPERVDTALYFLREYRKIDTLNLFVNELYGRKLFFKRLFQESLVEYKKLRALGDVRTNINYYLAQNYAYLDSIPQACDAYEALLEQVKGNGPAILMKYGMLCASNDMPEKAVSLILEAKRQSELSPTVKALMIKTLANCYYKMGDDKNAIEMLLLVYEENNASYEAAQYLANIYNKLGNTKQEKLWIERFLRIVNNPDLRHPKGLKVDWYESRLKELRSEEFMKGDLQK